MSIQTLEQLLALAEQAAVTSADMNEAVAGGGGAKDLPTGATLAYFCEYVEFGQQPQEFGGKPKEPAMDVQLGFALLSPGYCNDDGSPYVFRPYKMPMSRNEKARAFLTFKMMNYLGTAKCFPQLIGKPYLLHIETGAIKDGKKKRPTIKSYAAPNDPLSGTPYQMPPLDPALLRMFLWDYPTLEGWDSLFIEGTHEGKSKNFIQEEILGALDFSGSPLDLLLRGAGRQVVIPTKQPKPAAPAAPAAAAPAAPVAAPAPQVAPTPAAPVAAVPAPAMAPAGVPFEPTHTAGVPVAAAPVAAQPVAPPVGLPAAPALPT